MFNTQFHYTTAQNWATLIGRLMFAFIFLWSGAGELIHFWETQLVIESSGITLHPLLFEIFAIIFKLVGGILLVLGIYARVGALLLIVFVIAASFVLHQFWNYPPELMPQHMIGFFKNVAIIGGGLFIIAFGPGDYRLGRKK